MPPVGASFRSGALCRRVGEGGSRARADIEGNCPFKGRVRKDGWSRGSRSVRLPACFEEALFLLLNLRPPGRGRGDVMGLRPLRSPLPTPRSTPLGIVHSSHPIPFGFQGKPPLWVPGSESRPSAHAPRWADHTRLARRNESERSASGEKQRSRSFRPWGMPLPVWKEKVPPKSRGKRFGRRGGAG